MVCCLHCLPYWGGGAWHLVYREWKFAGWLCVCGNGTAQRVVQLRMSVVQDGVCGECGLWGEGGGELRLSVQIHCPERSSQCKSSHSGGTLATAKE